MTATRKHTRRAAPRKLPIQRQTNGHRPPGALNLASAKPPTNEAGTALGSATYQGVLSQLAADYAPAWQRPKRWDTIATMRTDPGVAAVLAALTFPILAAPLTVEAASTDPDDVRMAEWLEGALHGLVGGLNRHRQRTLDRVGDGVVVTFPVYEQREGGLWYPRKFAPRPNATLRDWHTDEHGGPDGVTQYDPTTGKATRLYMDDLLVFTHMQRDDLLGVPAIRAMYRPWFLIDKISRIGAMSIERGGMGIPWARYEGSDEAEAARIDRMLMGVHAGEYAFLRWGADVKEWGMQGVTGTVVDPVPFMEYQRRDLFLAPLCQFLTLGTDGVGSMALSEDQTSFFAQVTAAIRKEEEDTYNTFFVPKAIGYNWQVTADRLPRVTIGTIGGQKAAEWFQSVALAVQAGIALPPDELSQRAGRLLGVTVTEADDLPGTPTATDPNDPTVQEEGRTEGGNAAGGGQPAAGLAARGRWQGVTFGAGDSSKQLKSDIMLEALGIRPNFIGMAAKLDGGRDRIAARLGGLQEKQANRLRAKAKKIIASGDPAQLEDFLNDPASIPYQEERDAIEQELEALYRAGVGEVGDELGQQGYKATAPDAERTKDDKALLGLLALWGGKVLADRMLTAFGGEVLRQMGGGGSRGGLDAAALKERLTGAPEKTLLDIAARAANKALGAGRGATIEANKAAVGRVVRSCKMDINSCVSCAGYDGEEWPADDARPVPEAECDGGDKCRCENVAVVSDAERGAPILTGDQIAESMPW